MDSAYQSHAGIGVLEKVLALLAAVLCWVITIWVLGFIRFPVLYLFEMLAWSTAAAAVTVFAVRFSNALTSIAAGAIMAFSLLAVVSVGFYYLPIAGLLLITGSLITWRTRRSGLVSLALAIGAGMVQVTVMLAVIVIQQSMLPLHR